MPTTEDIVGKNSMDRDAPPSPSLAKLLQKPDTDALPCRQQHFDSGGSLLHMDGGDSWGSISKMLHQRYNSGGSSGSEPTNAATGERFGLLVHFIVYIIKYILLSLSRVHSYAVCLLRLVLKLGLTLCDRSC